jgi:hypothetical protein
MARKTDSGLERGAARESERLDSAIYKCSFLSRRSFFLSSLVFPVAVSNNAQGRGFCGLQFETLGVVIFGHKAKWLGVACVMAVGADTASVQFSDRVVRINDAP